LSSSLAISNILRLTRASGMPYPNGLNTGNWPGWVVQILCASRKNCALLIHARRGSSYRAVKRNHGIQLKDCQSGTAGSFGAFSVLVCARFPRSSTLTRLFTHSTSYADEGSARESCVSCDARRQDGRNVLAVGDVIWRILTHRRRAIARPRLFRVIPFWHESRSSPMAPWTIGSLKP